MLNQFQKELFGGYNSKNVFRPEGTEFGYIDRRGFFEKKASSIKGEWPHL